MSDVAPLIPNLVEEQREKAQRLRSWVQAVSTQTRARSYSPNSESPLSLRLLPTSAQSSSTSSTSTSRTSSTTVDAHWSGYEPNSVNAAQCAFGNTINPSRVRASTAPQNIAALGPTPYSISPLQRTAPPIASDPQVAQYVYSAMKPNQNIPQGHLQSRVGTAVTSLSSVRPPMTLDTAIPGPMPAPLTKLMPAQPPRPEPIYAPGFGAQVYPNSTTHPSSEHRPMLQAATHFFQDQSQGSAGREHHHRHRSRRPRSASHPRAVHREDIDAPESKSHSIPKGSRNRSEIDRIPLPADYVPVSRAHKQSPSSTRGRDVERSIPPPDRSKAFPVYGGSYTHSRDTRPTATNYLQAPYDSSRYSASHATPSPHRSHHHGGHGHNHRHRASSQPPQKPRHHHQSHAALASSRPTYARQRSYSVDASDPRIARLHQTGTFPTSGDYNTGHSTRYGSTNPQQDLNYIQQPHSGAHTPSQSSNYRFIVQPPSTTRSNAQSTARAPIGVPVSDGRGGWVIVPRNGQDAHNPPFPQAHDPSAYSSHHSRGRKSSPGFWGSLFGRKRRSNSATPGAIHSKNYHEFEPQFHYGHGNHRPHNIRRRSSR